LHQGITENGSPPTPKPPDVWAAFHCIASTGLRGYLRKQATLLKCPAQDRMSEIEIYCQFGVLVADMCQKPEELR
jgi:hypothetical protein